MHWDGNNNSVHARNLIAGISAGASVDSLDGVSLRRTEDWLSALNPLDFPSEQIDLSRYEAGFQVFQTACSVCHAFGGALTGQVIPIDDIGTDPDRFNAYTQEIADRTNALGGDICCHEKSIGYSSPPLDGIDIVSSVEDVWPVIRWFEEVLQCGHGPVVEVGRPQPNVGFITDWPDAESTGFRYDTSVQGNGNQGHEYGTGLSQQEIDDLLEYLKTQ